MTKRDVLFLFCFIFLPSSFYARADLMSSSFFSPTFLRNPETDTVFRNPSELSLYDKVIETRFAYGIRDKKANAVIILHLPDHFPIYRYGDNQQLNETRLPFGNIALSFEYFASQIGQNLPSFDHSSSAYSSKTNGYKMALTWAKQMKHFNIGVSTKKYDYQDPTLLSGSITNTWGWDAGFYLKPFRDLYFGAVINDIGSSILRDKDGIEKGKVLQELRLTAAIVSNDDMSFSIGIPSSLFDDAYKNKKYAWKYIAFQGSKVFEEKFSLTLGSNTKDIYTQLGFIMNPNFKISLLGARNIDRSSDWQIFTSISLSYPVKNFFAALRKTPEQIKTLEEAYNKRYLKPIPKENIVDKPIEEKEREDLRQKRLNAIHDKQKETDLSIPPPSSSPYDEVREELEQELKKVKEQQEKIKKKKEKLDYLEKKEKIQNEINPS